MPPKQSTSGPATRGGRGRPSGSRGGAAAASSKNKTTSTSTASASATARAKGAVSQRREARREVEDGDEMEIDVDARAEREVQVQEIGDDDEEEGEDDRERIPPELLTRILYEFFEREGTRITKDANSAVARYVDVFVREAIARAAVEREGGFLEVEDLEKIAPQLLMDL
ncbi:CENP-S associating centromere protein X-domain-containing protein [Chaetomium strumarium]|uniref:CENP-S associating centromere protein X-domain-containing protein n=1 Tax=Chaetomium strumarium TaxID=1170767 RepID=A0AAJ0M0T9_9PEZI|nr:CENP-S associating centromere protein X-domain-containing protein [Chaetomium strumarium]